MAATPPALQQSARQITRKSRSNFYFSFLFLPREKREALYSIYAFCRRSDDIADQNLSLTDRQQELERWRIQLAACYEGRADTPAMKSLGECVRRFQIPKSYLDDLIRGVEMDLTQNRYPTFDALYPYCFRVASTVGLICIEVFGYQNPNTRKYAEYLGVALQLTNILRDVGTDGAQDRIYIPLEDLQRFGLSEADILERRYTPAFIDLMAFQAERAESFYQKAAALLPPEDRRNMLPAEIMGAIYHRLLERIRRTNYPVFNETVSLPDWRKFLVAFRLWLQNLVRR
jgi:phytoene synthase